MLFQETRDYLQASLFPADDSPHLPTSTKAFSDGGLFKWEVPGPIDAAIAEILLDACDSHGVHLNQITYTPGIMRLLDSEIIDLAKIAEERDRQIVLAIGPRSAYDISAQRVASGAAAQASASRLRGVEQVVRAVADVDRGVDLGVRGFLVFDEGLLWLLNRMRADGKLPSNVRFKASSAIGAANPFHCRSLVDIGADAINLQRDLDLGMIAAARAMVDIPLDLHTDNPSTTGGFIRTYEIPEMVRVGSPVYLKAGGSITGIEDEPLSQKQVTLIAREIAAQAETVSRLFPTARQSLDRDF